MGEIHLESKLLKCIFSLKKYGLLQLCICLLTFFCHGCSSNIEKVFWENGALKALNPYNASNNIDGTVREWYPNGTQAKICEYRNGVKHGVEKEWTPSGDIFFICNYKDGLPHGAGTWHYSKGKISRIIRFVNGKSEWTKTFSPDGQYWALENNQDNKANCISWQHNGEFREVYCWISDNNCFYKREYFFELPNELTKVTDTCVFIDSKAMKHGIYLCFSGDKQKNIILEEWYDRGVKVSKDEFMEKNSMPHWQIPRVYNRYNKEILLDKLTISDFMIIPGNCTDDKESSNEKYQCNPPSNK